MVSTKLMLYKHKTLSNGKHPIVMQVLYRRRKKNISLGYHSTIKEWNPNKNRFRTKVENSETKNMALRRFELLATKIIDDAILSGKPFSLEEFKRKLIGNQSASTDIFEFIKEIISDLVKSGKIGNSTIYKNVHNSLKAFTGGKLAFEDLNVTFLNKYEVWLASDKYERMGCAPSTMNQYMRTVCAVFNKAISRGLIAHEIYPFRNQFNPKGYSYSHLKSEPNRRALSLEEMQLFKDFEIEKYPHLHNAYFYFLFMYYCRGINWSDLCNLKHTNLRNGRLLYKRKKTGTQFSIKLNNNLNAIINRFNHSPYIFPVLSDFHKKPLQKAYRLKKCLKQTNSALKEIAMRIGIDPDITTYSARHTYAMNLKRAGINLNLISDAMGHADSKVTRSYLSRFEDDKIDETDSVL